MMIGARNPFPDMIPGPMTDMPIAVPPQMSAPPAQGGKPKINWLGVLADALAGAAGRPGPYAQSMERQRQEQTAYERGEQQYRRQRADSRDDFLWKQQNENRAPDEFTRLMDAAGITPDQRPGMYKQALDRKINPPRTIVMADGTVMELPGGASPMPVPQAPIGPLTPIGGPMPQASGGFPRYR